jgi:hypothetical protein
MSDAQSNEDDVYVVSASLNARAELVGYLEIDGDHKHAVEVVDLIDALIIARVRDALAALEKTL